jgi:hypothetical protein
MQEPIKLKDKLASQVVYFFRKHYSVQISDDKARIIGAQLADMANEHFSIKKKRQTT